MGQLYAYRGIVPTIAASASLFPTAEITGDVVVGERTIIGAGVKIIGDSHGPVRIGNDVQILENTVLHLLPDNELVIDDGVDRRSRRDDPRLSHRRRLGRRTRRDRVRRQRGRRRLRRARRRRRQAALAVRRRHRDRRLPGRRRRALTPTRLPTPPGRCAPTTCRSRHRIGTRPVTTVDTSPAPSARPARAQPAYRVDLRAGPTTSSPTNPPPVAAATRARRHSGFSLSGLVACTAMTLRMYAERKDWNLASLEVDARYDVRDDGSASIERTITLPADVPADQRDRLAEIAERTPVTLAVRAGTPIITTFRSAATDDMG